MTALPALIADCSSLDQIAEWLRSNRHDLRTLALDEGWWDPSVGNLKLRFWNFGEPQWLGEKERYSPLEWQREAGIQVRLTVHGAFNYPLMNHLGFRTEHMEDGIKRWVYTRANRVRQTHITVFLPARTFGKLAAMTRLFEDA